MQAIDSTIQKSRKLDKLLSRLKVPGTTSTPSKPTFSSVPDKIYETWMMLLSDLRNLGVAFVTCIYFRSLDVAFVASVECHSRGTTQTLLSNQSVLWFCSG